MVINEAFKDKILVITGGTGSFGSTVLKHFLSSDISEIRIISRDEKKQVNIPRSVEPGIRRMRATIPLQIEPLYTVFMR